MEAKIHHLPDGRLKVGDHFITDEVAIELISRLKTALDNVPITLSFISEWTSNNFPTESLNVIQQVLDVGSQKHKPGAWRQESTDHHAAKALGHLKDFVYRVHINSQDEDTLAHALTRLAMAVSVRGEEE